MRISFQTYKNYCDASWWEKNQIDRQNWFNEETITDENQNLIVIQQVNVEKQLKNCGLNLSDNQWMSVN